MAQAINNTACFCPLCGEAQSLDLPDYRVAQKWRGVLRYRELWATVADEFRASQSIEAAAARLSMSEESVTMILEFLCLEVCGCRAVTCVSCLDDYRSAL